MRERPFRVRANSDPILDTESANVSPAVLIVHTSLNQQAQMSNLPRLTQTISENGRPISVLAPIRIMPQDRKHRPRVAGFALCRQLTSNPQDCHSQRNPIQQTWVPMRPKRDCPFRVRANSGPILDAESANVQIRRADCALIVDATSAIDLRDWLRSEKRCLSPSTMTAASSVLLG